MSLRTRRAPDLLANWKQEARRLAAARRVVIILDFDGTLVPLTRRPEPALLNGPARNVLKRLVRGPMSTVVIISGRRRRDLQRRVRIKGIRYWGWYGWERGRVPAMSMARKKALRHARLLLAERLTGLRGVWLEDKRLSIVLHCRGAAQATCKRAKKILHEVLGHYQEHLGILWNDRAWEVMPRGYAGKGQALRVELAKREFHKAMPVYFGDDHSDESAFGVLRGGLTIRVGKSRPTLAQFSVRDPQAVLRVLREIEALLR
jgi:trehalose 6-phosphate phosphatase